MKKPTKSQIRKALKESIKHWKAMIEWANKQKSYYSVSDGVMYTEIGIRWYDGDCPLCSLCRRSGREECVGCPLGKNIGCCEEWGNVDRSSRWGIWVFNAEKMLGRLEKELAVLK